MGDVTNFPPKAGCELAAALKRVEQDRAAAAQIQSDIVFAAGLLGVFADKCGEMHSAPVSDEIDRQWHQVEYLARTLLGHAKDLGRKLDDAESAIWAATRAAGVEPEAPTDDGGAA